MKKSIALVLVTLMLLSIAAVSFAACNHSWYTASTTTKSIKETIAYQHGCIHLSNPHTHWRYRYERTTIYVCSKGCGQTKTNTYVTGYYAEHCPKH